MHAFGSHRRGCLVCKNEGQILNKLFEMCSLENISFSWKIMVHLFYFQFLIFKKVVQDHQQNTDNMNNVY